LKEKYLNVLFHIDELGRDSIVASALKRFGRKRKVKIFYCNKKVKNIIKNFNFYDAIILPSIPHYKFYFPDPCNLPKNIFILPTEAVGQSTGRLRRIQAKYLGIDDKRDKAWHKSVKGYLLWGAAHKENIIKLYPEYISKCFVVGHPRISKYTTVQNLPEANLDGTLKKIGLISRFGGINPYDNRGNLNLMFKNMRFLNKNVPKFENSPESLDAEDLSYTEFIDLRIFLTLILSLDTDKFKIFLKPHPRENASNWIKFFKENKINAEIEHKFTPFAAWLHKVDLIVSPPSTSFYEILRENKNFICIDKVLSKRENHILSESDDKNQILKYVCRPESINELLSLVKQNKIIEPKKGYFDIVSGQTCSINNEDSIENIIQIIRQKSNSKESKKIIIKKFINLTLVQIINELSALKNIHREEEGSVFSLTLYRVNWINRLSKKLTTNKFS